MTDEGRLSGLAELLMETGHSHHEAFLATDGADPEWPLWYSQYLQGKVDSFLDVRFRALGTVEMVASLGLVFPIFISGVELLAPLSAAVLVVLQSRMGVLHWRRTGNGAYAILTVLLILGLLVVIWGRLGPYPL